MGARGGHGERGKGRREEKGLEENEVKKEDTG